MEAAFQEYQNNNFEEASSILRSQLAELRGPASQRRTVKGTAAQQTELAAHLFNNLGAASMKMGKYNSAQTTLGQGLRELTKGDSGDSAAIRNNNIVLYNYALSLLHSNSPVEALQVFSAINKDAVAAQPFVWIRMAECCIAHQSGASSGDDFLTHTTLVSMPKYRRILLTRCEGDAERPGFAQAVVYLGTALQLVRVSKGRAEGSLAVKLDSHENLEELILLKLSFVQVKTNQFEAVVSTCKEIFSMHKSSGVGEQTLFLADLYYLEALCKCGRLDDALRHLSQAPRVLGEGLLRGCYLDPTWTSGVNVGTAFGDNALSEARILEVVDLVNTASALLSGHQANGYDLDTAEAMLERALAINDQFLPTVRGLVYIYLKKGAHSKAVGLIRCNARLTK